MFSQGTHLQFTKGHQCLNQRSSSDSISVLVAVQGRELPGCRRTSLATFSAPILNVRPKNGALIVQWETGLSKQYTLLDEMGKVTSPIKEKLMGVLNRSFSSP